VGTGLSALLATPLFVVECYWTGITVEQLTAADERTRQALAQTEGGAAVYQVGSILIPTDELVLRIFTGGSAQLVEAASRHAAIPFERVVSAVAIDGPTA